MPDTCVYVREICPACQGTGKAKVYDEWGCQLCRNCDGKRYITFWQPVVEFVAGLGNLTEIIQDGKVQP